MEFSNSGLIARIDERLRKLGISRNEALKCAGLNSSSINDWIRGRIPAADKALKLSVALDVPLYWLLTGEEEEKALTDDEAELLGLYRDLDKSGRDMLLGAARAGASKKGAEQESQTA
jgi:transcriptional regulator with XRE-family HTH domain